LERSISIFPPRCDLVLELPTRRPCSLRPSALHFLSSQKASCLPALSPAGIAMPLIPIESSSHSEQLMLQPACLAVSLSVPAKLARFSMTPLVAAHKWLVSWPPGLQLHVFSCLHHGSSPSRQWLLPPFSFSQV